MRQPASPGARTKPVPASPDGLHAAALSLQRLLGNRAAAEVLATQRQLAPRCPAPLRMQRDSGLSVAPAGGGAEHEADRVAAIVVRDLQQRPVAERSASGQRRAAVVTIAARTPTPSHAARDVISPGPVARSPAESQLGAEGGAVDAATAATITRACGTGKPLDAGIRRSFEDGFGADFSGVRVHDDATAHALSDRLSARAFTTGGDIFLGRGGFEPSEGCGQQLLAHELTHVVQQQGMTAGARPLIQRNYAALSSIGQRRVDQEVEETYKTKALDFELGMTDLIEVDPRVGIVVDRLVAQLKRIVDAWVVHTGGSRRETLEREFGFVGGDSYYGAFEMTAANIDRVLSGATNQPLRTRLKLVYNAVRNNSLTKWLKLAAIELDRAARGQAAKAWQIRTSSSFVERPAGQPARLRSETRDETVTPGFAQDSGLYTTLGPATVTDIANKAATERQTAWSGVFNTTRRDVFHQKNFGDVLGWKPETVKADKERIPKASAGVTPAEQRTLTVGDVDRLTDPETDLILKKQGNLSPDAGARAAYRAARGNRLPWTQGGEYYDIQLGSESARAAQAVKARLEAGISGSTDLMLHAAEYLGVQPGSQVAKALRLALAGWMIANRDHSFYEVYQAAVPYGLPFTVNPAQPGAEYEVSDHLVPMTRPNFIGVLPNDGPLANPFPADYFSMPYKDHVAANIAAPADTQAQIHTALRASGLSATALSTMDERDTAALQQLDAQTQAQPIVGATPVLRQFEVRRIRQHAAFIHLGNVYGRARADAMLNALLRHHHAAAGVSHDDPRTQLADAGIPRAILDHVDDPTVGRIDAVRQAVLAGSALPAGAAAAMNAIDAATLLIGLPAEQDAIKWDLIAQLRPAWALDAGQQGLADTLERGAQIEQIADMERTSGVWYSWGGAASLRAYATAPSLRAATKTVPSTQGPGLYIGHEVTTSSGYGKSLGQRCLVIKMQNVPTIDVANPAQMAKLAMLQPRDNTTADPLAAAYLYSSQVSVEILMLYGAGGFGRLTTNKGVMLSMDLKLAPADHLRAKYQQPVLWSGRSRENILAQANASGIDTSGW